MDEPLDNIEKTVNKVIKKMDEPPLKTEDMRIPKYEYILDGEVYFEYVFTDDIPEEYKEEFFDWMFGQTMPVVDNARNAVYAYDYERWVRWKTGKTDILIWD